VSVLDPTRRRILSRLAVMGPMNVRQLSKSVGFYLSPTQYQVAKLDEEGLIELRRGKWGSKNCWLTLGATVLLVANDVAENIVQELASNWKSLAAPIFSFWHYFREQGVATPAYRILQDACREIVKQYEDILSAKKAEDMILFRLMEEFFVLSPLRQGRLLPGYNDWLKAVQENPSTYGIARFLAAFLYLKRMRETERTYDYLQKLSAERGEDKSAETQLEEAKKLLDNTDFPALLEHISRYIQGWKD